MIEFDDLSTFYDSSGRLIHETCVETTTYTGGSSSTKEITYLYDETGIVGAVQKVGSTEATLGYIGFTALINFIKRGLRKVTWY